MTVPREGERLEKTPFSNLLETADVVRTGGLGHVSASPAEGFRHEPAFGVGEGGGGASPVRPKEGGTGGAVELGEVVQRTEL